MYALTFWNFKKEINLLCDKINILMVEKRATEGERKGRQGEEGREMGSEREENRKGRGREKGRVQG